MLLLVNEDHSADWPLQVEFRQVVRQVLSHHGAELQTKPGRHRKGGGGQEAWEIKSI